MIAITKIAEYAFYTVTLVDFRSHCGAISQNHYEIIDNNDGKCYGICYTAEEIQPKLKSLMSRKIVLSTNTGT